MNADAAKQPAIARIWRGRTRRERADEYEICNYDAGVRPPIGKALGVQCLHEDRAGESEFMTICHWDSVEATAAFTGADPHDVHHLPRDAEFLIELPTEVQVLQLRHSHGITGGLA